VDKAGGITYDRFRGIYVSDGTLWLHFWDRDTLHEKRRVEIKYKHRQNKDSEKSTITPKLEWDRGTILLQIKMLRVDEGNEALGLSREQADAVLKLQLGQLTRLNEGKLEEEEKATLEASQKELNTLVTVDEAVLDVMNHEFEHLKTKFGKDWKTQNEVEEEDLSEMDLIWNSRSVIVVTRGGSIKFMPLKMFESQRRGTRGKKGTFDQSEENEVPHCFTCNDHDTLLMVSRMGIAYGLRAFQVPTGNRTAKGTLILPAVLPVTSDDVVTTLLPVSLFSNDEYIVLASEHGWIKKTPSKHVAGGNNESKSPV